MECCTRMILNLKAVFSSTTTVLAPSSWHSIAVLKNNSMLVFILLLFLMLNEASYPFPTTESTRVAMATFWPTFHHDGKISPAWSGGRVHIHPLSLYLPSRTKL